MTKGARKKILFVDDDESSRNTYCEILSDAGYYVVAASDGKDAFGKLRDSVYDIVITDIKMPLLDGVGLYLNALKFYVHLKDRFLFVTDDACEDREARSILSGLNKRYLVKPLEVLELTGCIESMTGEGAADIISRPQEFKDNRRSEKRFCWEEDCRVSEEDIYNPRPFTATVDVSKNGARIRYIGYKLKENRTVRIDIRCLKVKSHARIIWSKAVNEIEALSGLKLYEPIPSSSIITVVQGRKSFIPPLVSSKR